MAGSTGARMLLFLGVALIVLGGVVAASWEPRVDFTLASEPISIPKLEVREPGVVEFNSTSYPASVRVWGDPSREPVEASLHLTPPKDDCDRLVRFIEYSVAGTVANGEATLTIRLDAVYPNGTRGVVREYAFNIPRLGGGYATATPLLASPGIEGSAILADEDRMRIELWGEDRIPPEAEAAVLRVELPLQGNITVGMRLKDVCTRAYNVDTPFLAPAGSEIAWVKYPVDARVDTGPPKIGVALMALGNALALLGIYQQLASPRDRG